MSEFSEELETTWTPIKDSMSAIFTTQDYVTALKAQAPSTWTSITDRHGPGGKGGGNFYSPSNIVFNFLKRKSSDGIIFRRQFVAAEQGWGSSIVAQWEFASVASSIPPEEGDLEFVEGSPVLRKHILRERHIGLRAKVLRSREKLGLSCDCCKRTDPQMDIRMQRAMFEVHHKRPLAEGVRATKVSDVNLLCATCHRLIHRALLIEQRDVSAEELARNLKL